MSSDLLAGRHRVLSPLGSGGMGEVFLAEDIRLERKVAVRMLPASIEADAVARERLRREALAAAWLDHPFICKVHEIGDADGCVFIVMEYVDGDTLHTHARRAVLPVRQVLVIAHELAQALDAAHRRGIVHRDLKPANVMVTPQGHVKVMDFGLAKQVAARPSSSGAGADSALDTQTYDGVASTDARVALTDAGTRIGTPAYMSPEQILSAALDPRSDLFSLGVMLHELATGRHPFLRDDPSDTMAAILRDPPTSGSRDLDEPAGFGAVIHRLLSQACVDLSDDEALDAIEDAERAQLVAADASQRTARYGFVHELIRSTLVNGLSLPRRQRLHLRLPMRWNGCGQRRSTATRRCSRITCIRPAAWPIRLERPGFSCSLARVHPRRARLKRRWQRSTRCWGSRCPRTIRGSVQRASIAARHSRG